MIMFGENLIFFGNFSFCLPEKSQVLPKNQSNHDHYPPKGPVNSIKKQKYIQIVGNI